MFLEVKDASGKVVIYSLEMGSPNTLAKFGMTRNFPKQGDEIVVDVHPSFTNPTSGEALSREIIVNGKKISRLLPKAARTSPMNTNCFHRLGIGFALVVLAAAPQARAQQGAKAAANFSGVWLTPGNYRSNPQSEWSKETLPFTPKGLAMFEANKPGKGPRQAPPALATTRSEGRILPVCIAPWSTAGHWNHTASGQIDPGIRVGQSLARHLHGWPPCAKGDPCGALLVWIFGGQVGRRHAGGHNNFTR